MKKEKYFSSSKIILKRRRKMPLPISHQRGYLAQYRDTHPQFLGGNILDNTTLIPEEERRKWIFTKKERDEFPEVPGDMIEYLNSHPLLLSRNGKRLITVIEYVEKASRFFYWVVLRIAGKCDAEIKKIFIRKIMLIPI